MTDFTKIDLAALKLAVQMQEMRSESHRVQIKAKLADEDFWSVAKFAAYSQQCQNLRLKPWETPPCHVDEDQDYGDPAYDHGKKNRAQALLRKMIKLGVSRYDPDPLAAIAAVRNRRSTEHLLKSF
jgi:hypothetical protein